MFEDNLHIWMAPATPVWELAREAPEVAARLPGYARDAAAVLGTAVPVLRSVSATHDSIYVRPPGHRRAFYVRSPDGVVAIKGSEPLAFDFAAFVEEMARARVHAELRLGSVARDTTVARAELSALDKLAVVEGKVPGCVTLREALGEAAAAAAVQRAHVARTGALMRIPVPLLVARWPEDVGARVLAQLVPRLRGRARDVVELSVQSGLGVYVYAYPAVPLRLAQLGVPDARGGAEVRARLAAVGRAIDPRRALEGWIGLCARLLAMGFVSGDPTTVMSGDCLQAQNVTLDGGLADVESVVEARLLDDRALRAALRRTVHELAVTATRLVAGLGASGVDQRDRLPDAFATVWTALADAFRAEEPRDARIAALLLEGDAYDRLVALLADGL